MGKLRRRVFPAVLCLILAFLCACSAPAGANGTPATAAPTPAGAETYSRWCRLAGEFYLSLYDAPSKSAQKLGAVYRGECVEILEAGEEFSRVYAPTLEKEGYLMNGYFEAVEEDMHAALSIEVSHESFTGSKMKVVCEEYITLRQEPDRSSEALATLPAGETVTLLGYSGTFAQVEYAGQTGYVIAGYLQEETPFYDDRNTVVKLRENYSYDQLRADIVSLQLKYPALRVDSIGTSLKGRDLPVLILGNESAPTHVIIQAAMHAREHMTMLLAMAMTEYSLSENAFPADGDVCLHVIPVSNPDGVTLAQSTELPEDLAAVYERDQANGAGEANLEKYLARWKANAAGVDLNRNFDAGYKTDELPEAPSCAGYPGEAPEDQPESAALAEYTRKIQPAFTLSYHSMGSIIYWNYGDYPANDRCWELGMLTAELTGYGMAGSGSVDGAGYKDWCITQGIPGLTIETGTRECPLEMIEFGSIWVRNKDLWKLLCAYWT